MCKMNVSIRLKPATITQFIIYSDYLETEWMRKRTDLKASVI